MPAPHTALTTTAQQCALTFYMFGNQEDRVLFTGLTAEELARRDTTTTGHKLTCACDMPGLTPLQWLDWNKVVLPNNDQGLVDYRAANRQPGSAVNLRINQDGFSCAEAGEYTCVVGTNNTRTVLVTPIGECGKQCRLRTQLQHTQQCLTVLVGGIPAQHTCDAWRVCL